MSWRLRVRHTTGYRYDDAVVSSYNEARLTPQTAVGQLTLEAQIRTSPEASQHRYWDYWGTQVTAFDVQQPHSALEVTSSSVVDTSDGQPAPREDPGWQQLRAAHLRDRFWEVLAPTARTGCDDDMAEAAHATARGLTPRDTVMALTGLVHEHVDYVPGATGVRTSATQAWALRQGVCQDIAHVSLALLRELGLPARYCSGYLHPVVDAEVGAEVTGESHAWVEVWLDGWWAYDPTNQVPVGQRHVLVARGRDYTDVTPLKGIYSGRGAQALGVQVALTRLL